MAVFCTIKYFNGWVLCIWSLMIAISEEIVRSWNILRSAAVLIW